MSNDGFPAYPATHRHRRTNQRHGSRYGRQSPDGREPPCTYSERYLWGMPHGDDNRVCTGRLFAWDTEAWHRACDTSPKRIRQFSPDDANGFLSAYFQKPVIVSAVAEGCNARTGSPYWVFWFTAETPDTNAIQASVSDIPQGILGQIEGR